MIRRIGFIGLGIMGKPMARNLINGGYQLIVHDVNRRASEDLVMFEVEEAFSPSEAAMSSDALITMLPDDHIVEKVIMGKGGVLESKNRRSILIDMSTISPITARRIAEKLEKVGMDMLDAPVSGGEAGAREGTLSIMVGGKKTVFDQALPILQKMGKNVTYVGVHGAGQVAKASNQIIVAMTIQGNLA